jgi:hypothetical protein
MRIAKGEHTITSLEEWRQYAPPKSDDQWVEGRSAYELARAWCGTGAPATPRNLHDLLESRPETRGLSIDTVSPEHRITFDRHGGEPRNADLAFVGRNDASTIGVTVEAKADELFGATVDHTIAEALERRIQDPGSQGVARVQDLVCALLRPRPEGQPHVGDLRYQLLTAAAGTLAYAQQHGASIGVLIVHEFVTDRTRDDRHARNAEDYQAFLHRLSGVLPCDRDLLGLLGPFAVPGGPLFDRPPDLMVGKIVTNLRRFGA